MGMCRRTQEGCQGAAQGLPASYSHSTVATAGQEPGELQVPHGDLRVKRVGLE